jgi:hypothetical protein
LPRRAVMTSMRIGEPDRQAILRGNAEALQSRFL